MDNLMNSKRICDRFMELSLNNELTFDNELDVLRFLVEKFQFKTIKHYSDSVNQSPQSIYQAIEKNKIQYIFPVSS